MKRDAFTLMEIMVTLAIVVAIAAVTSLNLFGNRRTADLKSTTQQIAALLREAQGDSLSQSKGATWGVHLDNTTATTQFYELFYSSNGSYSSATIVGHYPLPFDICFATSTVPAGSSTSITFSAISGAPSASATVTLQLMAGGCAAATGSAVAASVTRSASGKIFFDDFNRANL